MEYVQIQRVVKEVELAAEPERTHTSDFTSALALQKRNHVRLVQDPWSQLFHIQTTNEPEKR